MTQRHIKKYVLGIALVLTACAADVSHVDKRVIAAPIEIDVNYVARAQGADQFVQLTDGAALRSGDVYKIIFRPREDCYVYIYQIDAADKIYSLFPTIGLPGGAETRENFVRAGQTYHIPAESQSFQLDDVTGRETIYFLAYRRPDPQLPALYEQIVQFQHTPDNRLHRDLFQQLDALNEQFRDAIQHKGISKIVPDPANNQYTTWNEGNKSQAVLRQRLEGMCDGCVNILKFQHQ